MYQLYRDRPQLVLFIVLANLLLSVACVYMDPVINNDGIMYLAVAELMLNGEWAQAFEIYNWPYYSMCVAAVAKLFFLDIESAAYLLNTLLATSLTLAFVCIVGELSNNNQRIILIAALVILFFPSITKYRAFIIRDFGYLSFYLWSLYFIFRFCRTPNKTHLLGWLLCAALSCLFRFEGIAFLLIAPYFLILFTTRRMPHRGKILGSLSVLIFIACIGLLFWYANDKYSTMIDAARESGKDVNNLLDLFKANTAEKLGDQALTLTSYLSLIGSSLGHMIYELIRRMAIFYFVFAIYAYIKNIGFTGKLMKQIWLVYVITNVLVLLGFSLYNNFLVSRYTMATALTLLIVSPFIIDRLLQAFSTISQTKRVASIIAIGMLTIASLEGLDVRTKKNHIKLAGHWLKSELGKDAKVFSNDRLIIYYADKDTAANLGSDYNNVQLLQRIKVNNFRGYDYVALSLNPRSKLEDISRQTLGYHHGLPIKIIEGEAGRAVLIFEMRYP